MILLKSYLCLSLYLFDTEQSRVQVCVFKLKLWKFNLTSCPERVCQCLWQTDICAACVWWVFVKSWWGPNSYCKKTCVYFHTLLHTLVQETLSPGRVTCFSAEGQWTHLNQTVLFFVLDTKLIRRGWNYLWEDGGLYCRTGLTDI